MTSITHVLAPTYTNVQIRICTLQRRYIAVVGSHKTDLVVGELSYIEVF